MRNYTCSGTAGREAALPKRTKNLLLKRHGRFRLRIRCVCYRWAIADGDGESVKPFKSEWATVKDGSLWVGYVPLLSRSCGEHGKKAGGGLAVFLISPAHLPRTEGPHVGCTRRRAHETELAAADGLLNTQILLRSTGKEWTNLTDGMQISGVYITSHVAIIVHLFTRWAGVNN